MTSTTVYGVSTEADPQDLTDDVIRTLLDQMARNHDAGDLVSLERGNRKAVTAFDHRYIALFKSLRRRNGWEE